MATRRADALELAVLGLLHESSMHGYELRKRVTALLGWGRVLSYGSLYPCLKQLLRAGLIAEESPTNPTARTGRRARIVYKLSAEGKERFAELVSAGGPSAWEDDSFGVRFAFFGATSAETRLRILEGRRSRLEERLDKVRAAIARSRERVDAYTLELQRHGLESAEREVRWLNELIDSERVGRRPSRATSRPHRGRGTGSDAGAAEATSPEGPQRPRPVPTKRND
ncbi:MAG TPA: PadR family transcriptional regulator [Nocardioidaceae bacterium]|nr:PadR family transcriptional regulator [Nocardioidaceae bacterium]